MNMRNSLYHYRENKERIAKDEEKIILLRTQAEKITPTLSDDKGIPANNSESKVEKNVVEIVTLELEIEKLKMLVKRCDDFLSGLRPYQKHIITQCIVYHNPYQSVAKRENTTVRNIAKIIDKALKNPVP